jgi:N-formylglutamate amidohydrolase
MIRRMKDISRFVAMSRGQLPLVLSAPHGGKESPSWIPTRTCGPHAEDKYTLELVEALVPLIAKEMGGRAPFAVCNKLNRSKMDANREINVATEGGLYASMVYELYHDSLQMCVDEAKAYTSNTADQVLVIDMHGYSPLKDWNATRWDNSWIMVGHLVSRKTLKSATVLPNEDWIRGPNSIGSLLHTEGLWAEPSMYRPHPHHGKYFSGGYITDRYRTTCESTGKITVQTIQLELPRAMRNDLGTVAPRMAKAIAKLLKRWKIVETLEQQQQEENGDAIESGDEGANGDEDRDDNDNDDNDDDDDDDDDDDAGDGDDDATDDDMVFDNYDEEDDDDNVIANGELDKPHVKDVKNITTSML